LEFTDAAGGDIGAGDVELGAKYRFLRQDGPLGLDVAIFPRVILPTAAARTQGDRKASFLLPLWAQRDAGPWSVFGGGGYMINRGPGARDFWTGGLAVTRQLNDRLTVGAEVYGREAEAAGGRSFVGANLGATYQLVEHWSLIGALGPGLQHAREEGRYTFYAALQAVF